MQYYPLPIRLPVLAVLLALLLAVLFVSYIRYLYLLLIIVSILSLLVQYLLSCMYSIYSYLIQSYSSIVQYSLTIGYISYLQYRQYWLFKQDSLSIGYSSRIVLVLVIQVGQSQLLLYLQFCTARLYLSQWYLYLQSLLELVVSLVSVVI